MASKEKSPIEKFDGSDYWFWRMRIKDYLYSEDLDMLLGEKPATIKEQDWKVLDRKTMSMIRLSLSRNVAFHTMNAKTTREILQILSNMYGKPSTMNKVQLVRRLINLKMSENSSGVVKHLHDFNEIISQLASVNIEFDDEVKALILLYSLSKSWDAFVTTVTISSGKEKLKFDTVRDLILNEETYRNESQRI